MLGQRSSMVEMMQARKLCEFLGQTRISGVTKKFISKAATRNDNHEFHEDDGLLCQNQVRASRGECCTFHKLPYVITVMQFALDAAELLSARAMEGPRGHRRVTFPLA